MSKIFKSFLSFVLVFCLFSLSLNIHATDEDTTVVGPATYVEGDLVEENLLKAGVVHQNYTASSSSTLTGFNAAGSGGGGLNESGKLYPQNVNLLYIPNTTYARVVNWTKTTNYGWARGTVKEIAKDFEAKNPGWKVIAAVNGDFFDIESKKDLPLTTTGSFVQNGEVLKTVGNTVLGFTNNGTTNTLIGNGTIAFTDYFTLRLYDEDNQLIAEQKVDNINPDSVSTGLTLYYSYPTIVSGEGAAATREYNDVAYPKNTYVVKTPERCIPYSGGTNGSFFGKGKGSFEEAGELLYTQFAVYSDNAELNSKLADASKIVVQRDVVGDYKEADNISGTGVTLVYDGVANVFNDKNRHPRTMIGVKADGTLVFCTVDGRQPEDLMYGMTYDELSALMYHYGCVAAYNMDGGGSTTMVIREGNELRVLNSPSDGDERKDSNAILVVIPEITLNVSEVTESSLVIKAPTQIEGVEVSNIKVTVDGKTYDLVDTLKIENLKSKTEYEIGYSYDRNYNGETSRIESDPLFVKTAKIPPTVSNIKYKLNGETLTVSFDISDPDSTIKTFRLYYTGGNKNVDVENQEVVIENVKSFKPEDFKIVIVSAIESPTEHIRYVTYTSEDFTKVEETPEKGSGCQAGTAYVGMCVTMAIGLAFIILKRK